jgi:hypothetical protein
MLVRVKHLRLLIQQNFKEYHMKNNDMIKKLKFNLMEAQ